MCVDENRISVDWLYAGSRSIFQEGQLEFYANLRLFIFRNLTLFLSMYNIWV